MRETFKDYRTRSEDEHLKNSLENLRLLIHELYFERLLDAEEASSLIQATVSVAHQADVGAIEKRLINMGALPLSRIDKANEVIARLHALRQLFAQKYDTQTLDNWKEGIRDFVRDINTHAVEGNNRLIRAWVSRLMEKAYYLTRSSGGDAKTFGIEIAKLLHDMRLPGALVRVDGVVAGKRQPSFIESVDSTIDHLAYVEELPGAFGTTIDAMIVGGSLSYGPFFNIRSNIDATGSSDVDTILIITPSFGTSSAWDSFMESRLFTDTDKHEFRKRVEVFQRLRHDGAADIMSHKFTVPGHDFVMSAHFFTPEVLEKMCVSGPHNHVSNNREGAYTIRDYKPKLFEYSICPQQTFDGSVFKYVVPPQEHVQEGYITTLPGYTHSNDSFFPGLYHNLISPEFSVLHDVSGRTRHIVDQFRSIMEGELARVQSKTPYATLALSHIRSDMFAPERYA